MEKIMKFFTSGKFLFPVQILISIILLFLINRLGILPMKYLAVSVALLLLLITVPCLLTVLGRRFRKTWLNTTGKVLSVLLSICLIFVNVFVFRSDDIFGNFGKNFKTHAVSIIVLKENKAKVLKNLKGKQFAATTKLGGVIVANAIENIEKDMGDSIDFIPSNSVLDMSKDLYAKKVDAIILNEMNRDLIKEKYKEFDFETKVIYQTAIKENIDNAKSGADVTKETTTIFVSGNDMYDGADEDIVKRSDVNMLITINPKTRQLLMTSIPRDTYVELASFQGKDKLTHASIYGLQESVDTLAQFFNCDIDYYFRINYSSLLRIVEALDGITVDNPTEFRSTYDINNSEGTTLYPQGEIVLNGERALNYARERQVFEEGDNMRIMNQQRVLTGIINKACSPTIITRYSKILKSLDGAFETNLEDGQIRSMIQMQLENMKGWDLQAARVLASDGMSSECVSMPGYELFVSIPDEESVSTIAEYIKKMENGEKISIPTEE